MSRRINQAYRGVKHVNGRYGPLLTQLSPHPDSYIVPKHAKSRLHSLTLPTNTQRAGLAPARSVYSTLLRNAAVRELLGALKICPGLPSS